MRKISAYEIALSALACALATIFLTVGVYVDVLLFTAYLLAGIALMLPLSKRFYLGYALAYVAACLLSLLFVGWKIWDVLPFIVFFGLHPLVNELQLKIKINRWLACALKGLWFDGMLLLVWFFIAEMSLAISLPLPWIIVIIIVGGSGVFILYDYVMYKWRGIVNVLVAKVSKK